MKSITSFIIILGIFASPARGQDLPILSKVNLVGSGVLKYLLWNVYEAQLYAPKAKYNTESTFALKLTYFRNFKGRSIAERSVQEMSEEGCQENTIKQSWLEQMEAIFPDVREGTSLVGVKTEEGYSKFYKNSELVGEIRDSKFSKCFFDIWLSPRTSEPTLRMNLLGIN